jgi:hypothetical protein
MFGTDDVSLVVEGSGLDVVPVLRREIVEGRATGDSRGERRAIAYVGFDPGIRVRLAPYPIDDPYLMAALAQHPDERAANEAAAANHSDHASWLRPD